MGGFDWAAGDYLSDALDSAERRADQAEMELSEHSSGRDNIVKTVIKTGVAAGTAAGLGYWAGTMGGMKTVGGVVPVNLLGGLIAKAAALFGHRHLAKISAHAPGILDAAGQGAIDQCAAMAGYFAGKGSAMPVVKGAATAGTPGAGGAATGRNQWQGHAPAAMGGGAHPTDYMTPDQKRVWESYAP